MICMTLDCVKTHTV